MSDQYTNYVTFAKVDVDVARELSRELGVRAMPTFIVVGVRDASRGLITQHAVITGWDEAGIRRALATHGEAAYHQFVAERGLRAKARASAALDAARADQPPDAEE